MFPSQFAVPSARQRGTRRSSCWQHDPDAKVLAGGHSLLPAMKLRLAAPSALVDIGQIDGLTRDQGQRRRQRSAR